MATYRRHLSEGAARPHEAVDEERWTPLRFTVVERWPGPLPPVPADTR